MSDASDLTESGVTVNRSMWSEGMIATCKNPKCRFVFPFYPFDIPGVGIKIKTGKTLTNCPRCNSDAAVMDGEFTFSANVMTHAAHLKPDDVATLLRIIREGWQAAQSDPKAKSELVEKIAGVAPALAQAVTLGTSLLALLIAIITYLDGQSAERSTKAYREEALSLARRMAESIEREAARGAAADAIEAAQTEKMIELLQRLSHSETGASSHSEGETRSKRQRRRDRGKQKEEERLGREAR